MKEIVIKITDGMYQAVIDGNLCNVNELWYNALKNGKVLPKGHGELKDTTTIIDKLTDTDIYLTDSDWKELGKAIGSAETLVEADKGEE